MTTATRTIEATWIRIQDEFLNHPSTTFTTAQIRQRAATETVICDAVIDGLVESGVVERTAAGYRLARPHSLAA